MELIADFQLHSKYAQAVSKFMDLKEIGKWASIKGIDLVATGDWQHPEYFPQIVESLEEVNSGIFQLKKDYRSELQTRNVKFLLITEISSIYKQGGKVRKVHNLIFSPSKEVCKKVIDELLKRGANLAADGRPIVGISSKNLLDLLLNIDPNIMLIPAHVWTPWFGLFGSKSGFDSIGECFEDLSDYIYGIETGLSSDPIMNWGIKELDKRSILSFSDAHSGPKMGRESTAFTSRNSDFNYFDILKAFKLEKGSDLDIAYTIEFFPEEGKYHWDGHREHSIRMKPEETKKNGVICPVCKRPMTIGVENRVLDLTTSKVEHTDLVTKINKVGLTFIDHESGEKKPFVSMIPLLEILTEVYKSKTKAEREYFRLTTEFSNEFDILLNQSLDSIAKAGGEKLAEGIGKVRNRDIFIDPGYDGVFGKVQIWDESKKVSLF